MKQVLGIVAAFFCMPLLSRIKKLGFGGSLIITGLIMSIFASIPLNDVLDAFKGVFLSPSTINTMLAVIMIGCLGTVLNKYGILQKIVSNLESIISNPKIIIMLLPAVLGMLPVPGGAILSAPFAKDLGEKLGLPMNKRSVINLTFRHVAMFLVPFSSTMLLVASLMEDVSVYRVILLNLPFIFIYISGAYLLHLKNIEYQKDDGFVQEKGAIKRLIIYSAPIYGIILINSILKLPMWISVSLSVAFTYFIVDEKKDYAKTAIKGINISTLIMLVGVYFIQNLIKGQAGVMELFSQLFLNATGFSILLVITVIATVLGLFTGLNLVSIGILLPLVNNLPIAPMEKTIYVFFILIWAYIGYYYSPLHLCQILSNSYMEASLTSVSKENLKLMPILALTSFILFYAYRLLLL